MINVKLCLGCKQEKNLSDFHKHRKSKDGRQWACKVCHNQQVKEWQQSQRGRAKIASYRAKVAYGLSHKQYYDLRKNTTCCQICARAFDDCERHIDHCHKSGVVRGLLCRNCNHLLGNAGDNILVLYAAANYLLENRSLTKLKKLDKRPAVTPRDVGAILNSD